jgi:glycosyltransferase involved in cell wall biosynthesis
MKIVAITEHYPAAFKTYLDTQFADFLRRGHDLEVLAGGRYDSGLSDRVVRWRLHERTTRYPTSAREVPRVAGTVARSIVSGDWRRLPSGESRRRTVLLRACMAVASAAEPDLVLIHGLTAGLFFQGLGEALPGVPIGLYYHGGEVPGMQAITEEEAHRIFDGASVVFTNTRFSARHAVARGCDPGRIDILPVGFDLPDYPDPGPRPRNRPLRLLSAGRMSPEKGFGHALEAVRLLRERGVDDIQYTLTGHAGPHRTELEGFVAEHDLADRVRFAGHVTTAELHALMARSDILLLPSLHIGNWAENQAAVVQEAMLMRALVIATSTGGVSESIPDTMRRFQVPPADPWALAGRIEEALALSQDAWREAAEEGRRFVERGYDIVALDDRLLDRLRDA